MRRLTLVLVMTSTCLTGCLHASPPKILPARDRTYSVARPPACPVVVWCEVPEDPARLEECDLRLEVRDGVVPHELRRTAKSPASPLREGPVGEEAQAP